MVHAFCPRKPPDNLDSNSERSINSGWHDGGYSYGIGMKVLKFAKETGGVWCPEVCSWVASRGKFEVPSVGKAEWMSMGFDNHIIRIILGYCSGHSNRDVLVMTRWGTLK